jgi:hypothetical protein
MVAALSASRGEGVIWVDTTNSFSPTRLQQLSESMQVWPALMHCIADTVLGW